MPITVNGTAIKKVVCNGVNISKVVANGVTVWTAFDGNLVTTTASQWTTSVVDWASVSSLTTNPIQFYVDSTAESVAGVGYAKCNVALDLSQYTSVTIKGICYNRGLRNCIGSIVNASGGEIVRLFTISDDGYTKTINTTVDLKNYSQTGYVRLAIEAKGLNTGLYINLNTLQFT